MGYKDIKRKFWTAGLVIGLITCPVLHVSAAIWYQENDPAITYTGNWNALSDLNANGGSYRNSNDASTPATVTVTFTGTAVSWISDPWNDLGIARVYIDGVLDATVDLYSGVNRYQQVVYSRSGLSLGTHTLKVEVTGNKNTISAGTWIDIDAFVVSSLDQLSFYWETYHELMLAQPTQVFSGKDLIEAYPSEMALALIAAYLITQEPRYALDADRQLTFARGFEDLNHLLVIYPDAYPYISRDYIARQIYNLYVAFKIFGNVKYLQWADEEAQAMITYLKRSPLTYNGVTYTLFYPTYNTTTPYTPLTQGPSIDLNQNAEIGLAFTLLYHEPLSQLHDNQTAADIALNELRASMALQDMTTGAIPVASFPPYDTQMDTGYASYTLRSWVWANLFWKDPDFALHIQKGAEWLSGYVTSSEITAQNYTWTELFDQPNGKANIEEAWDRFPAFYFTGTVDIPHYVSLIYNKLFDQISAYQFRFKTLFGYFEAMGIPRSAYMPSEGLPSIGLSVTPSTWPLGTVLAGSVINMSNTEKLFVQNTGNTAETFTLRIANTGGIWSAANTENGNSQPNTFVLSGLFSASTDTGITGSHFNTGTDDDVISPDFPRTATTDIFGNASATTANGVGVAPNETRALWLQFKAPPPPTVENPQSITLTIEAIAQ
ncbi:MAG: hypothetical protein QME90_00760 [Thermodesulfobacteriota bacterium]|nr:hypothetical protein [Thermodesulfobacteriota bacterium]